MGFLLVCMGVQFIINGILKSLKRIIKKGPNGPFNYCVCLRVSLASGEK